MISPTWVVLFYRAIRAMVEPKGDATSFFSSTTRRRIWGDAPFKWSIIFILAGYSFKDHDQPFHLQSPQQWRREDLNKSPSNFSGHCRPPLFIDGKEVGGSAREQDPPLINFLTLCSSILKRGLQRGKKWDPHFILLTITPTGYREIVEEEVKGWSNGSSWWEFFLFSYWRIFCPFLLRRKVHSASPSKGYGTQDSSWRRWSLKPLIFPLGEFNMKTLIQNKDFLRSRRWGFILPSALFWKNLYE